MTEPKKDYRAYLIRLWRSGGAASSHWRGMLEDPHTGERHGFSDLDGLFEFLHGVTRSPPLEDSKGDPDPMP